MIPALSARQFSWILLGATLLKLVLAAPLVLLIVLSDGVMKLLYSWRLKQVGIPPSSLLLTGMMETLGFAKHRAELVAMSGGSEGTRKVLHKYSPPTQDRMIGVCATGVVAYSLYTMSPPTIAIHQTENLIYAVPLVLYGLFRYLHLTATAQAGENPARDLLRDPQMWITVLLWAGLTLWLLA
ncbi:MAG: hypothetical protein ACNA75_05685 [Thiohalomonadaceae bacterium]